MALCLSLRWKSSQYARGNNGDVNKNVHNLCEGKKIELLRPHSDGYGKAVASPMRKNKRRILVIGISV